MKERELLPHERAKWGECPVCRAREGDDCNPQLGVWGVHFGRINRAPKAVPVPNGDR